MKTKWKISTLYCLKCGHEAYIPRKLSRLRETDHIKTMYCPYCKSIQDFIENPSDDCVADILRKDNTEQVQIISTIQTLLKTKISRSYINNSNFTC